MKGAVKNFLIFLAGMLTMFVIVFALGVMSLNEGFRDNLTILEAEGKQIPAKQIKIFQVLEPNVALAFAGSPAEGRRYDPEQIIVLLIGDDESHYYDDELIEIPNGKVTQVGTFNYETNGGRPRTVPAVKIQ